MKFSDAGSNFIKFSNSIIKCFDYILCKIPFVSHRLFVCIRICWRTGRRNRWRKGDNFLFRSASTACMKSLNTPCMKASLPASPAGHTIANLSGKLQKFGRKQNFMVLPRSDPCEWFTLFCFCCLQLAIWPFFIWHWTWAVGLYCCHLLSLTIVIIAVICPRSNQLSMFVNLINIPLDMGRQRTSRSKGGIEIIIMLHSEAEAACQEKLFLHLIFLHLI